MVGTRTLLDGLLDTLLGVALRRRVARRVMTTEAHLQRTSCLLAQTQKVVTIERKAHIIVIAIAIRGQVNLLKIVDREIAVER